MYIRINKKRQVSAESFAYYFAAFNGLGYYAFIFLLSGILPFEKGIIRFVTSLFCLLVALVLFLLAQRRGQLSVQRVWPIAVKALIAYFLWSLLSFLWSDSGGFSTQGFQMATFYLGQWLTYVVEFVTILLICMICPIEKLVVQYLKGLRIGGFVLASVYLLTWLFIAKAGRLSAFGQGVDVIHPNNLALKLAVSIICAIHLYFWLDVKKRKGWIQFAVFTLPMLFALMLTIGKTVLVGFFIALFIYFMKSPYQKRLKMPVILLMLLVAIFSVPWIYAYLYKYWNSGNVQTLSGRTELWAITLRKTIDHPIIGHGIASPFPTLSWNVLRSGQSGTAHNEYLNALYEMGGIGLAIVLSIYVLFLRNVLRSGKRAEFKAHTAFCLSIFIIMFIFSMTASFPVGFAMPVTFQLILHCWMSNQWNYHRQRPSEASTCEALVCQA